jgi:hypothetical protein
VKKGGWQDLPSFLNPSCDFDVFAGFWPRCSRRAVSCSRRWMGSAPSLRINIGRPRFVSISSVNSALNDRALASGDKRDILRLCVVTGSAQKGTTSFYDSRKAGNSMAVPPRHEMEWKRTVRYSQCWQSSSCDLPILL